MATLVTPQMDGNGALLLEKAEDTEGSLHPIVKREPPCSYMERYVNFDCHNNVWKVKVPCPGNAKIKVHKNFSVKRFGYDSSYLMAVAHRDHILNLQFSTSGNCNGSEQNDLHEFQGNEPDLKIQERIPGIRLAKRTRRRRTVLHPDSAGVQNPNTNTEEDEAVQRDEFRWKDPISYDGDGVSAYISPSTPISAVSSNTRKKRALELNETGARSHENWRGNPYVVKSVEGSRLPPYEEEGDVMASAFDGKALLYNNSYSPQARYDNRDGRMKKLSKFAESPVDSFNPSAAYDDDDDDEIGEGQPNVKENIYIMDGIGLYTPGTQEPKPGVVHTNGQVGNPKPVGRPPLHSTHYMNGKKTKAGGVQSNGDSFNGGKKHSVEYSPQNNRANSNTVLDNSRAYSSAAAERPQRLVETVLKKQQSVLNGPTPVLSNIEKYNKSKALKTNYNGTNNNRSGGPFSEPERQQGHSTKWMASHHVAKDAGATVNGGVPFFRSAGKGETKGNYLLSHSHLASSLLDTDKEIENGSLKDARKAERISSASTVDGESESQHEVSLLYSTLLDTPGGDVSDEAMLKEACLFVFSDLLLGCIPNLRCTDRLRRRYDQILKTLLRSILSNPLTDPDSPFGIRVGNLQWVSHIVPYFLDCTLPSAYEHESQRRLLDHICGFPSES